MKIKVRLILYFTLLAIAIFVMIFLLKLQKRETNAAPRDYAEIMKDGFLNIVTDYNTIGYHISGDTVSGFQYEMIKILEKDWKVEIRIFLENSLDQNLDGLKSGKYDIVARNIPINSDLMESFAFPQFIIHNKLVLIQRKAEFNNNKEPIRQQLDLAKKTIHVHQGSPAILRINNLSHEIGDTIFIAENHLYETEQLIMMVAGGDIDMTISDKKTAEKLAQVLPEIDIVTDISFTQLESWAVRKESPVLLDSLNNWFKMFLESKDFKKLYDVYYN